MAFVPDIPAHYISEKYEGDGYTVTIHRNPHPDPVEHEKAMQEIYDFLMDCLYPKVVERLQQRGYFEKVNKCKSLKSVDECTGVDFEFVREEGNDYDDVYYNGKLIGYQPR